MPILPHLSAVLDAWGFRYMTVAFTWTKVNRNGSPCMELGAYTRTNAELCVLGVRGHPRAMSHDVSQLMVSCPREHSRKPDEQ